MAKGSLQQWLRQFRADFKRVARRNPSQGEWIDLDKRAEKYAQQGQCPGMAAAALANPPPGWHQRKLHQYQRELMAAKPEDIGFATGRLNAERMARGYYAGGGVERNPGEEREAQIFFIEGKNQWAIEALWPAHMSSRILGFAKTRESALDYARRQGYRVTYINRERALERNPLMMVVENPNDEERRQWVSNDEGLYDWYRSSRLPMREFIKLNRAGLDEVIARVTGGDKPAHYMKYGPGGARYNPGRRYHHDRAQIFHARARTADREGDGDFAHENYIRAETEKENWEASRRNPGLIYRTNDQNLVNEASVLIEELRGVPNLSPAARAYVDAAKQAYQECGWEGLRVQLLYIYGNLRATTPELKRLKAEVKRLSAVRG